MSLGHREISISRRKVTRKLAQRFFLKLLVVSAAEGGSGIIFLGCFTNLLIKFSLHAIITLLFRFPIISRPTRNWNSQKFKFKSIILRPIGNWNYNWNSFKEKWPIYDSSQNDHAFCKINFLVSGKSSSWDRIRRGIRRTRATWVFVRA